MKNKKLLLALLAACCTLSVGAVAGCGDDKTTSDSTPTSTVDSTSSSSSVEETQTFTVTFNSDGGSAVQAQSVEVGAKVTKPADPTKEDDATYTYAFAGWYNGETEWNFDTDTVAANVTLTAKWTATEKAVTFTVKFETNGGTAVADAKIAEGADLTNVDTTYATTKSGLTFAGWYYTQNFQDGTRVGVDMTKMPSTLSGNATTLTVYAKWIVAFTVSFDSNGGSQVSSAVVEEGTLATKPADPTKDSGDATKVAIFDGWYNGETAWNFDTDMVTANVTLTAKWVEKALPTFIDSPMLVSGIECPQGGEVSVNTDSTYIAQGDESSIKVTLTNDRADTAVDKNVSYAALLPATKPSYGYYEMQIYSSIETVSFVGDSNEYRLRQGWNTVQLTWEVLTDASRIYIPLSASSTMYLYLGSVKAYDNVSLPAFIDGALDYTQLTGDGTVSVNKESAYIDNGDESSVKVTLTNNTPGTQDRNINYSALVPATAPSYDYYVWRIYSSLEAVSLVGGKEVRLAEGWNTVQISYTDLTSAARIYLPLNANTTIDLYLGSLKGYYELPDFIDGELDYTQLTTGGDPVSLNRESTYIDNGDASSVKVTFVNGHPTNARDCNINYSALLPATEPSYDYYEWRIYSSIQAGAEVGSKAVTLQQGWNTVQVSYEQLTTHKRIYIYLGGGLTLDVYLGSLTGVDAPDAPAFIDGELDYAQLTTDTGTVSLNTDSTYIASGDESSVKVTFTNNTPGTQDCKVYWTALIPATEPSYDYYVWKIYSSVETVALVGDKNVTLTAGWNTVQLSYAELTTKTRIYLPVNANTTIDLYLGSLTGGVNAGA